MQYENILEEEIKNKVSTDYFGKFDCTKILGKIDFAVKHKRNENSIYLEEEYLLWAEAKQKATDIIAMLAQLVLTIGKARTFDEIMPPKFLGCYDSEKIAFVPYHDVQDIFYQNDFNWNVAPSNHDTREFKQVYTQIKEVIESEIPHETYLFNFEKDEKELKLFIRENFIVYNEDTVKIRIDKNNFINIYQKWIDSVKPTIAVNWEKAKTRNILDCDFYLADLISQDNKSIKDGLSVLLEGNHYKFDIEKDDVSDIFRSTPFSDNQKAYAQFWAKYERPPIVDYWDYIIDHRHLLVPQDIRERKGSFYTPRIWVEKSQEYLAKVFGENWQEEYYIWDCAAGTGNLLAGLVNKHKIWASTLDKADVDVMHDRIENGANLLHAHVFQFDFLNDDFSKLPEGLQTIINDPKLRQRLVIYINPPYAESGTGLGKRHKDEIATETKIYHQYKNQINKASLELFAQFLIRIYCEIQGAKIANFSKLKNLQSSNFSYFRKVFNPKLEKIFLIPADTFDNVKGQFPIGFFIWNTEKKEAFKQIQAEVYVEKQKQASFYCMKKVYCYDNARGFINDWLRLFFDKKTLALCIMHNNKNDFQHNNQVRITSDDIKDHTTPITINNLIAMCIYFAVRKVIPATWLNDRDQFLYPNKKWAKDIEFHNDCLAYAIFNNNISSKHGVNHWIPFPESEVNAPTEYKSHILIGFLQGKKIPNAYSDLFSDLEENKQYPSLNWSEGKKREFSPEAQSVFDAGRELWKYYHSQKNINVNASLYDIREYFQGRNDKGKMNAKSDDEKYNNLLANLRKCLDTLAKKIEPKVYEFEFLLR